MQTRVRYVATLAVLVLMSPMLSGSGGGCGGHNGAAPAVFSKLAGPTNWTFLARAITVDGQDGVYVTSGSTIFRVDHTGPSVYLDAATIAAAIGGGADPSLLDIMSLDVGPDQKLYFLDRMYRKILVSSAPGGAAVHRDLSGISGFPWYIGVVDENDILLINLYDGMWSITDTGNTLLYDSSLVLGGNNCGTEGLAVRPDGYFAYLPGCNGSPVVGGKADGTQVGLLLTNSIDVGLSDFWNFSGVGRDPAGGYVLNINGARLLHATTDSQYELIPVNPELDTLATDMEGDSLAFYSSPVAVGPTGRIYIISQTSIYVAE